ncbi:dTDP-4-dehydrorhamnose reductase [Candidatus Peregrinibacteria bacterium]|nr:dTDP-4-dehydrorhamnose reductase [Candidatus Peregrinibacteria bacterium]
MKILLLGKSGLLGHALEKVLSKFYEICAPSHKECDITDQKILEKFFADLKPDIIINSTGYTAVDDAETHKEEAFRINSDAVKNLAQISAGKNIPLVHFSTDYVFNGKKPEGYSETDSPSPISVYGASKASGEEAITKNIKKYYLIRTAWLYGESGKNFVDTIINLASKSEGKSLKVVNDQIGNPTYTLDLAQALLGLLKGKSYGIYHIVNSGQCSWYEFAQEIFRILGIPQKIAPITSCELVRRAKRPKYSILKNTRLPPLRDWKEALASYLKEKTLIL